MATKKYVVTGDQALRIGNRLAEIQRQVFLQKEYSHDPEHLIAFLQNATEGRFANGIAAMEVEESKIAIPSLRSTPPTLADWLKAREELHKFFTGEQVVLRDRFSLTEEELASTNLMPAFRPAGATNRMAVEWKLKVGENKPYEEVDVMRYTNSQGPKQPELYLINRSIKPDADTLGDNAKTPDQLVTIKGNLWLNLFGWCDADTLHHAITGGHLDPETWTWFPNDRLPGGGVAGGCWDLDGALVCLYWLRAGYCDPRGGARAAKKVPLKT